MVEFYKGGNDAFPQGCTAVSRTLLCLWVVRGRSYSSNLRDLIQQEKSFPSETPPLPEEVKLLLVTIFALPWRGDTTQENK